MAQREWFYVDESGKEAGPVSNRQLRQLAESGILQRETLIWAEGMQEWAPAGRFSGFQRMFEQREMAAATEGETAAAAESQSTEPANVEESAFDFLRDESAVGPAEPVAVDPLQADSADGAQPAAGVKVCPSCGHTNPQQAAVCAQCGANLVVSFDDVLDGISQENVGDDRYIRRNSPHTETSLKWILNVRKYLKSDMYTYGNDTYPAVAAGIRLVSMLSKIAWWIGWLVHWLVLVGGLLFAVYALIAGFGERSRVSDRNEELVQEQLREILAKKSETDSPLLKQQLDTAFNASPHEEKVRLAVEAIAQVEGRVFVPFELEQEPYPLPGYFWIFFYPILVAFLFGLIAIWIYILNNIQFVLSLASCEFVVVFCDTEHHVRPNQR